jgi:hypothetical protein
MSENSMADAAQSTAGADGMTAVAGVPRHNRRLGDKVLAAFNHAYAVGALDVASQLRAILARIEADRGEMHGERRYSSTTLGQADLWMAFVEARNDYQAACDASDGESAVAEAALDAMQKAYEAWLAG